LGKLRHHIIGTGRWGTWLARRLVSVGYEVVTVRNRSVSSAKRLGKELSIDWCSNHLDSNQLEDGDLVWCCVPDAEILVLHEQLKAIKIELCVVHCSGTSPLLKGESTGVFWPIQSITGDTEPDWSNLPIVVQASNEAFAKTLKSIAINVSALPPKLISSNEDRMRLHLGAVMTQNFSNLLWTITQEVLAKADLDYKALLPLAQNHLEKLAMQDPSRLQTGPASRGDKNTLSAHAELLAEYPSAQEIYRLLSEHIANQEN